MEGGGWNQQGRETGCAHLRARLRKPRLIHIREASCLWLVHPVEFSKLCSLNCAQLAGWKSFEKYPEIATHQGASVKNTDHKWAGRGSVTAGHPATVSLSEGVPGLFPRQPGCSAAIKWLGLVDFSAGFVVMQMCSCKALGKSESYTWNHIFQMHSCTFIPMVTL